MISKEQKKSNTELRKKHKFLVESRIDSINNKFSKYYDKKIFEEGEDDIITVDDRIKNEQIGYIFNYTINEPSSFKRKYKLENVRSFIRLWSRPIQKTKRKKETFLGIFDLTSHYEEADKFYEPDWREYNIEYTCGVPGYFKKFADWSFKGDLESEIKYHHQEAIDVLLKYLEKHEKLLKMYVMKELEN